MTDAPGNFIFYPGYRLYFGRQNQLYHYPPHDGWAAQPESEGINIDIFGGSPTVRAESDDAPPFHPSTDMRQYRPIWSSAPVNEDSHGIPDPQHGEDR
jgi:hypothetical protein